MSKTLMQIDDEVKLVVASTIRALGTIAPDAPEAVLHSLIKKWPSLESILRSVDSEIEDYKERHRG